MVLIAGQEDKTLSTIDNDRSGEMGIEEVIRRVQDSFFFLKKSSSTALNYSQIGLSSSHLNHNNYHSRTIHHNSNEKQPLRGQINGTHHPSQDQTHAPLRISSNVNAN
jgi:hypothetical protein